MLIACVIWGCAFAVMKDALDAITPNYILAFRFTIAAVLMGIFMWKKLGGISAKEWLAGLVVGVLMYGAYLLQTVALQYTTAGKNAFLTAVYVVLVPFMLWGVRHIRPDKFNVIAAVLCLLGIDVYKRQVRLAMGNAGGFCRCASGGPDTFIRYVGQGNSARLSGCGGGRIGVGT